MKTKDINISMEKALDLILNRKEEVFVWKEIIQEMRKLGINPSDSIREKIKKNYSFWNYGTDFVYGSKQNIALLKMLIEKEKTDENKRFFK